MFSRFAVFSLALAGSLALGPTTALAQSQSALAARAITALQNVCTAGPTNGTLAAASCDIGFALGGAVQAQAALTVTPREASASSTIATQTTDTQVDLVRERIDETRAQTSEAGDSPWGTFLNASGGFGDVNARGEAEAYDVWGTGLTGGLDRRFSDAVAGGIALGWNRQETEFDTVAAANGSGAAIGGGDVESDSYSTSFYGSYSNGPLQLDGVASYTFVDYEFARPVILPDITTPISATAMGDTHAHQLGLDVNVGYELLFGEVTSRAGAQGAPLGGLSIGPIAGLAYRETWIDAYSESGVPGVALGIDDQQVRSVVSSVGAEASLAVSSSLGVIVPHLRATWEHEFQGDPRNIEARLLLNDASSDLLVSRTSKPDRNYGRLGIGSSLQLAGGMAFFVDYDTVLGLEDVDHHRFTAGGRIEF